MEIIFQSHHAPVSQFMRDRAERRGLADAVVTFSADGPVRRVLIVLHAPRHQDVRAEGTGPRIATALSTALARLDAQTRDPKRPRRVNPLKDALPA